MSTQNNPLLFHSASGDLPAILFEQNSLSRSEFSRLQLFLTWSQEHGQSLLPPNLAGWRTYLEDQGKKKTTIASYLATVRQLYRDQVLVSNTFRDRVYHRLPNDLDIHQKRSVIDELLIRVYNALEGRETRVSIRQIQDEADGEHIRLSWDEVRNLVLSPGAKNLADLRNTALLALLICTGIRAAELRDIQISDLRQELGGELALRVFGKRNKQRLVPYGSNTWGLALTEKWLSRSGVSAGRVFIRMETANRIFLQEGECQPLSLRSIRDIVGRYEILHRGRPLTVTPHDLRRTYARALREIDMPLDTIQQNLGHDDIEVTKAYIGTLDGKRRAPSDAFRSSEWMAELLRAMQ